MSLVDLQALAKRSRVSVPRVDKHSLVDALLLHVRAGTISLDEWEPFALPNDDFPNAQEQD
jgi:hypothetical protein